MVSAYILIQTEVGKAAQVTQQVSGIDGIVAVDPVTQAGSMAPRSASIIKICTMVFSSFRLFQSERRRPGVRPAP